MIEFDLIQAPNQRFSALLDGAWFEIEIKTLDNGACAVSIRRDNETIIQSVRALPNRALIPYLYREHGNFIFLTNDGEYPMYTQFGGACRLIYVTPDELKEIRGG